jgi:endoglucanase
MQGTKVGWIAQELYDPQIVADIQRTARLGDPAEVLAMVR